MGRAYSKDASAADGPLAGGSTEPGLVADPLQFAGMIPSDGCRRWRVIDREIALACSLVLAWHLELQPDE